MKIMPSSWRHQHVARVSIFLIIVALIAGMVGCAYAPSSSQNLEIRTWYDLDAVRNNLGSSCTLMNNLDSSTPGYDELAGPTANDGKGWQPIGTPGNPFTGTLDGNGYEIRDIFIDQLGAYQMALFGIVGEQGLIENVGVVNATVTSYSLVGGLVGVNYGTVDNSYSTGEFTGETCVGGLVGYNAGAVANSYSSGKLTGERYVGGLVGKSYYGTVSDCHSVGNVAPHETTDPSVTNYCHGGLVGRDYGGTVSYSYSSGNVTGEYCVGGLVGNSDQSIVTNSYSSARVTGNTYVGGLVGYNAGTVGTSYSSATVTGDTCVGGLMGYQYEGSNQEGTVSNSFWDINASGQSTSDGGTSKTTEQMKNIATFSGAAWDIIAVAHEETNPASIWNIVDGETYPFLR